MEAQVENCEIKNSLSPPSEILETKNVSEENTSVTQVENIDNVEAKIKKVEVKLTKLDDIKLLDKNENSIDNSSKFEFNEHSNDVDEKPVKSSPTINSTVSPVYSPSSTTPAANSTPIPTTPSSTPETPGPGPSKAIKIHPNGNLPKSGKPMMTDMKKLKQRGRPKQKPVIYQSQLSDNSNGIKLCIKKSMLKPVPQSPSSNKQSKKKSKKSKHRIDESDSDDGYVKRRKKVSNNNNYKEKGDKAEKGDQPVEQSLWGSRLPKEILHEIFYLVTKEEGCYPTMFKLGKVCSLWRDVSLDKRLWHTLDLNSLKESKKTEEKLKWIITSRMIGSTDINISFWKVTNVQCVFEKLYESCPGLVGIALAGWRALNIDNLAFLTKNFTKLERLDLSSINMEMNSIRSAVSQNSLINAIETMKERLTHLHLAHNRLSGIPQMVTALTANCPNLLLLDLSNVITVAASHGILHIEKLQVGCQKLKILRIANSHITLSNASMEEQMESPGFPALEELSVASLAAESRLISDESLQRILKSSKHLRLLDVRGCARLTHDSLIRLPCWDLKHLFLSGCSITRDTGSGLELISSKWAHSLTEFDLAWANVQEPLDAALRALAEKRKESKLNHLNLCGSAVSEEATKEILTHCPQLISINLSSCRGLPRGIKRLIEGKTQLNELRENLGVPIRE